MKDAGQLLVFGCILVCKCFVCFSSNISIVLNYCVLSEHLGTWAGDLGRSREPADPGEVAAAPQLPHIHTQAIQVQQQGTKFR